MISRSAPAGAGFRQPDEVSPRRFIRRPPARRDRQAVRVPCCLSSAGVFVIVVGNYLCAAFYEASGASTCRFGFNIPVETSAPPWLRYVICGVRPVTPNPQEV